MEDILQLLHHCKCGLWHLVHHGPGGPGIPWGCCMDACNPLLRRRPCQLLRLLLLLLGLLLLVHHGIPWGCCMNACNHLLCRRVRLLLWLLLQLCRLWLRRRPCLLLRLLLLLLGLAAPGKSSSWEMG